jgi:hypothetical protein
VLTIPWQPPGQPSPSGENHVNAAHDATAPQASAQAALLLCWPRKRLSGVSACLAVRMEGS